MTGYTLADFKPGQALVVGTHNTNPRSAFRVDETPHDVTVARVGRKWVTIATASGFSPWRFDPEEMEIDGGDYASPGNVYWNRFAFDQAQEKRALWTELQTMMRDNYSAPYSLTAGALRQFVSCMRKATK